VGVSLGFLQALEYAGIDLYPWVSFLIKSYYHGLSLNGVLNMLVWTTFPSRSASTINTPTQGSAKAGSSSTLSSPLRCFSQAC
jgi:hypothetical protein